MSEEAEWDTSKENFVPVKQGRATSALVTPVSVQKRDKELEDAKRDFVEEIQAASDDPLPAWLKYIKWTQEQYSTQASRRQLTQALEAATKALSGLQRYHDDVRLLRLWVQYADCLPDPSSVFLFLEDHNIGRDHALFYEAYAAYLELKGNFSQADLVYQEGIKRLAKPLERLKQKHAAFNQRMAKRRERQESEAAIGMGPAADPTSARSTLAPLVPIDSTPQLDENGRPIQQPRLGLGRNTLPPQQPAASVTLGVRPAPLPTASSSRGRGAAGSGAASLWAPASSGGAATQQRSNALLLSSLGVPGAGSSSSNAAPRQLDIHVDEEFGPSGRGPIPTAFPPSLQQHAQLPGLAVATKENSSQPAVWAGTKLKQQGIFAPGPVSNKLEVFEDDDSEEGCEGSAPDASSAADQQRHPGAGLRQRLDAPLAPAAAAAAAAAPAACAASAVAPMGACAPGSSAAAAPAAVARKQQLRQESAPAAIAAAAPAQQTQHGSRKPAAQGPVVAAAVAAGGAPQGFDEALLVGPGGEELSFEEVRAAAWRKAHPAKQPPAQQHPPAPQQQQQMQQQQQGAAPAAPAPAAPAPAPVSQERQRQAPLQPSKGAAGSAHAAAPELIAALDSRSSTQHKASSSSSRRPLGEAAVLPAKPDAPGRHVGLGGSGGSHAAAGGPIGADGCQSSSSSSGRRQPFAASAAGSAAPAAAAAAPSAVDDAAGGVTINTQAAFDAMNGMFGGSDDTTTMHGFGRAAAAAAGRRPPAASAAAADLGGVTINTRAAFDAMNGMFGGDDTTTMHGFGKAAAGGAGRAAAAGRRSMAAGDIGGVTMNTRAAFDAMNGMFGGDDTTTMHGFGRPAAAAAAGARRPIAAGDPGGVTMNTRAAFDAMNGMFGGDDTTTMHGFGRAAAAGGAAAAGAEPTVTVNTRAAFDYMNGVFGAAGDVTMNQTAAVGNRKGPRKTSRLAASTAAAAAGGSNGGAAAPMGLYEDTELLNPVDVQAPDPGCADQGPMFGVYEDTEFVVAKMAAAGGRSSRGSGQGSSEGAGSSSFGLYEDTDFITRPVGGSVSGSSGGGSCRPSRQSMAAAGAGGGGLGLYEDTDFIPQPASKAGRSGSDGRHSTSGTGGGGMGLYEDTDFITKHVGGGSNGRQTHRQSSAAAAAAAMASSGGLGLYEDTEFISQPHASTTGGGNAGSSNTGGSNERLSLYEDTEFIDAAAAAGGPASAGPCDGGQGAGLGLYEDTEFITGSMAAAAGSGAGCSGGGSGSGSLLLTKLNRLSLANGALYKGQQQGGLQGSCDDENAAPNAAPSSSLGLYEDTEFIGDAGRPSSLSSGAGVGGLEVYADTEFLTKPVAGNATAAAMHGDPGQRGSSWGAGGGNSSSHSADGSSSRGHHHHQQQHQHQQQQQLQPEDSGAHGTSGRSRGLAAAPKSPHAAAVGPCGSSSGGGSILQQPQHHGYAGAGPSRFGPGSVPSSPVRASRPGSAKSTPGRPPRTPGTPGAGLGPMAQHMESFEVMESPAVHEALAGRPPCPTTASSPAGSFTASPGFGARENSLPGGHVLPDGKEGQRLQPRSLTDRSARAAALQPLSTSRAELLGVQVDPHALVEGDEDDEWGQQQQEGRQKGMARQSPGRALRSLQFGRGSGIGAPSDR